MTKRTRRKNRDQDYRVVVRAVGRRRPDVAKFAKAVIELALQEAARETEARRGANLARDDGKESGREAA